MERIYQRSERIRIRKKIFKNILFDMEVLLRLKIAVLY